MEGAQSQDGANSVCRPGCAGRGWFAALGVTSWGRIGGELLVEGLTVGDAIAGVEESPYRS